MVALGYTMVYGVLQLLNFAHSEIFMVGSFAGLYALSGLFDIDQTNHPNGVGGIELVVVLTGAIVVGALVAGGTAVAMERVAYRPLRRKGATRLAYLITAIGVSLFLANLFQLLDGQQHLGLPFAWPRIAGAAPVNYPPVMGEHPQAVFTIFGVTGRQPDDPGPRRGRPDARSCWTRSCAGRAPAAGSGRWPRIPRPPA